MAEKYFYQIRKYIEDQKKVHQEKIDQLAKRIEIIQKCIDEAGDRKRSAIASNDTAMRKKAIKSIEKAEGQKNKLLEKMDHLQSDPLISYDEYSELIMDLIEYVDDACDEDRDDLILQLKRMEAIGEFYRQRIEEADQILHDLQYDLYHAKDALDENGQIIPGYIVRYKSETREDICQIPDLIRDIVDQVHHNQFLEDVWDKIHPRK